MIHTNGTLNGQHVPDAFDREARRRAARRWIIIPTVLITVQMSIVITMVWIATNDPTFAVEPHYYEKALAWDTTASQRQANERLAWRLEVRGTTTEARVGELRVRLSNSDGLALDGAMIRAEVFANTNAQARTTIELAACGEGAYAGAAPFDRAGMWECRLVVTRGPERFTADRQVEVTAGREACK